MAARVTGVGLDDLQIERYSRQIVLPEIGPLGQARLLAGRVAVRGGGIAAARVVGYLAAAGVGTLDAPAELHAAADPGQTDVRLVTPSADDGTTVDVLVVAPASGVPADAERAVVATEGPQARHVFWIAGGRAGALPPCPACAAAGLVLAPAAPELAPARDALLGTVVATEVVKALLGIGTARAGEVLRYDPERAEIGVDRVGSRPGCRACAPRAGASSTAAPADDPCHR